jgi:hypothetical protein
MSVDLGNVQVQGTTNYLVPSSGGTHAVPVNGEWTNEPQLLDWRNLSESDFPFQPQGVFIDNSENAADLTVTILPIGWNVICPPNSQLMCPFPAPSGQTAQVTYGAAGPVTALLVFVDFPVLPFLIQV